MKNPSVLSAHWALAAAAAFLSIPLSSASPARDKQAPKLFGGWELSAFLIGDPSGKTTPFCEGAYGKLIYEKSGTMSVGINCGASVPSDAPAHEYGGLLFYSGTFAIQGNTLLHRITNSTRPELIGQELPRQVESLTDTALVLTGKMGASRTLRIEWRRIAATEPLAPRNEIALLTYLKLKPGTGTDFALALQKIIKPSLSEPGNIAWFVQHDDADPSSIVFYTRWINEEALQAHLSSPPLVDYISKTAPFLEPGYPQLVRFHPMDLPE